MCNWYCLQCHVGFAYRTERTRREQKQSAKQKRKLKISIPAVWCATAIRLSFGCRNCVANMKTETTTALQAFESLLLPRSAIVLLRPRSLSLVATFSKYIFQSYSVPIIEHSKIPQEQKKRMKTNKKTTVERAMATRDEDVERGTLRSYYNIISERSQKHRHIKIDEFTTYQCDLKCKIKDWKDSKLFLCCHKHTNRAHAISGDPSPEIERSISKFPCDVSGEAEIRVLRFCCWLQFGSAVAHDMNANSQMKWTWKK